MENEEYTTYMNGAGKVEPQMADYMGCYQIKEDHRVFGHQYSEWQFGVMSPEECFATNREHGTQLAALISGYECWGGFKTDVEALHGSWKKADADCNLACENPGDGSIATCGGEWRA